MSGPVATILHGIREGIRCFTGIFHGAPAAAAVQRLLPAGAAAIRGEPTVTDPDELARPLPARDLPALDGRCRLADAAPAVAAGGGAQHHAGVPVLGRVRTPAFVS